MCLHFQEKEILRKNIKTFLVKNPYAANDVVVNHFIFHFKKVTQELPFTIISRDEWKVRLLNNSIKIFKRRCGTKRIRVF